MTNKRTTEVQLLRPPGNSPLQIEITLPPLENHISMTTSAEHLSESPETGICLISAPDGLDKL